MAAAKYAAERLARKTAAAEEANLCYERICEAEEAKQLQQAEAKNESKKAKAAAKKAKAAAAVERANAGYECSFPGCIKKFRSTRYLRQHFNTHTSGMVGCTFPGCLKQYSTKDNLTRHFNKEHKDLLFGY